LSLFLRDEVHGRKANLPPGEHVENTGGEISLPQAFAGRITPFAQPAIQHILRWQELNDLYTRVNRPDEDDGEIWARILRSLNVVYQVPPEDLANVPKCGPLVVVANHPYGGIEGVMLAALLRSVRSDIKVMANQVLWSFPGLRKSLIPIDPFGKEDSARYNVRGLKAAISWIREGGVLAVFPAGEVAHVNMDQFAITDPVWHDAVAAIIRRTSAAAVPVFFAGSNGPLFQFLGMVHPLLRTVMLPSELLNKRNQEFQVRVGHPLPHRRLTAFPTDHEMTAYLRWRTYLLGHRKNSRNATLQLWRLKTDNRVALGAFTPPEPREMEREICNLRPEQILLESGDDAVVVARAGQIPQVLREIGRLREIAFRAVGEGTGKQIDLDSFDSHYDHLFVWKKSDRQILGAYRLGLTELILKEHGRKGLYTSTLFDFQDGFFPRLGPALELGRSFVRLECQGTISTLPLLWKGIGRYILRRPQCKILFGPVSISNTYHPISQNMMVTYLQQNHLTQEISRLVKPRTPFKPSWFHPRNPAPVCFDVKNVEELSELISEIETDRKRVPILLKHYLKLGGKIVGFNVDSHFSHVVDGLIVVDLTQTERRILERFFEPEGARRFMAYHAGGTSPMDPTKSPASA
jgi:putative hemolysin